MKAGQQGTSAEKLHYFDRENNKTIFLKLKPLYIIKQKKR